LSAAKWVKIAAKGFYWLYYAKQTSLKQIMQCPKAFTKMQMFTNIFIAPNTTISSLDVYKFFSSNIMSIEVINGAHKN
jgi:hypothetical protein